VEQQFIAWLRQRLPPHPLLRLGPGDDAAVLNMAGVDECVITVDLLTDHVDFVLAEADPRRVGRKALAVNLSDLAAMAARPLAAVLAVALPRPASGYPGGRELAVQLYEGLLPLAEQFNLAIAGGDTNSWNGPLVITATLLGQVTARGPLRRGGARPGDRIIVTGAFGGSILGRHFDFQPRVSEALLLNERYELHAGMDVSDGLALDLSRLIAESSVGAIVDVDRVPIHNDARRLAAQLGDARTPLEHALGDGEDFELLLAVGPEEARRMVAEQSLPGVPLTDIGGFGTRPGLWQRGTDDLVRPLTPTGWEHNLS
jgi:thiamine-monophosphate kinase